MDLLYFEQFKTLFAHEDQEGVVLKIKSLGEISRFYEKSSTNGLGGRQLKKSAKGDLLFILSG